MEHIVLVLILIPVMLLLGMQWLAQRRARLSIGRQVSVDEPTMRGEQKQIYFFHATHCGPCRAIKPLVQRLSGEYPNLVLVDVVEEPEQAREFGIAATPSFIVVKRATISEVKLGTVSESWLRTRLAD